MKYDSEYELVNSLSTNKNRKKIRVGLIGIGNCASMLVQGVYYYKRMAQTNGLITPIIGKYGVEDIEFVAAFDVSKNKVGKTLNEAIFEEPNLIKPITKIPISKTIVSSGPIYDGVAKHMFNKFKPVPNATIEDVISVLKKKRVEILINLLPVGSQKATESYVDAALAANCAFINAIPVFIASDPNGRYQKLFRDAGLPLIGDDMKGQLGATILHRNLVALCKNRGITINNTYQLNIGGNSDFMNMRYESRLKYKRISKTDAVKSVVTKYQDLNNKDIRIGPSDYVEFLGNNKIAYLHINGKGFASQPVNIEVKLEVEDKMNSSAVLVDVIRATKLVLDNHESGPINWISAFYFKHPYKQANDDVEAFNWFNEHIKKYNSSC